MIKKEAVKKVKITKSVILNLVQYLTVT